MDRDATVALFLQGKDAWNAWANERLAERKAMEADGRWSAEKNVLGSLKPKNDGTRAWMDGASADFSRCLFLVRGAEGTKETAGEVRKEDAASEAPVKSIHLDADLADFSGFVFPGPAHFVRATFTGPADFGSATFPGPANFGSATFTGPADFRSATFTGYAEFESATFTGDADFESATFTGPANFGSATFTGPADFGSATFPDPAYFVRATFTGPAYFGSATFTGDADFESATFTGPANFGSATFTGPAFFGGLTFTNNVFFNDAAFGAKADFALVKFERIAQFNGAWFGGEADFNAMRGERAFSMAGAVFDAVPDFIQAHFEEAPRLDNMQVVGRMIDPHSGRGGNKAKSWAGKRWQAVRLGGGRVRTWPWRVVKGAYRRVRRANADMPARWRALKRLAIQGHDTESELEFHARETRSQRFVKDWPFPWPFWRSSGWAGFLRFWFGMLYQTASDFGRSITLPLAFWLVAVVAGAVIYVSQSPQPEITAAQAKMEKKGASRIAAAASVAWHAWLAKSVPCYAGGTVPVETREEAEKRESLPGKPPFTPPPYVAALSPQLQHGTDIANEAWHLAFRNAFILLDGSAEAAHRSYGCLYGVELYGGSNPLAVVPSAVSTASALQKLASALFIFLFGLALRNMLKMK